MRYKLGVTTRPGNRAVTELLSGLVSVDAKITRTTLTTIRERDGGYTRMPAVTENNAGSHRRKRRQSQTMALSVTAGAIVCDHRGLRL